MNHQGGEDVRAKMLERISREISFEAFAHPKVEKLLVSYAKGTKIGAQGQQGGAQANTSGFQLELPEGQPKD